MAKGKKTGGRTKGVTNKRTDKLAEAVAKTAASIEAMLPNAFEGDSHAFLMTVYKNTALEMDVRIDAAKAAIGYEKPRLSSIEANVKATMSHEDTLRNLEEEAGVSVGLN